MQGVAWTLLTIVLTIAGWELVRWAAWRTLRERWQRSIGEWMRTHDVRLEHFRFVDRMWVRQTLLQDPVLDGAAAESAAQAGVTIGMVRARMEQWLDEIVPVFNVFSYYKLGGVAATAAVHFCYELVFDQAGLERARRAVPTGAVTVYVANHRSNADYIVLSVGAMRQVALSYAVGEWARVWPLDTLFRSFGSYLIRRGERDPLYHRVLSRYLQLVAARGLTTAFFLEGALSRDGGFRAPKIGLLDYLVGILADDPEREIVFVPVGLNFDRVLEDRNLIAEAPDAPPPRARDKLHSLMRILRRTPRMLLGLLGPRWLDAHRRFGYAAVCFGAAVPIRSVMPDAATVARLPRKERQARIAQLADRLMGEVARVVPATPVCLTSRALLAGAADTSALVRAVREEIAGCRARGLPVSQGRAFASVRAGRAAEADEGGGAAGLSGDILDGEEAERTVDLALELLRRRGLVVREGERVVVAADAAPLLRYYARSLDAPRHFAAQRDAG
jgi:glycerol-3-phosphate O-acyltransferase